MMTRAAGQPGLDQRGFTLAELLVVVALVGLVMAGLLGLIMSGQQAFWFGSNQVDAQQNLRVGIERMVREIREAGYDPVPPDTAPATCASPPCYTFSAIAAGQTATSLMLQYNWNGSGTPTSGSHIDAGLVNDPLRCPAGTAACRGEQVTYSFGGGNLTRQESGVDATPQVVASGLTGLTFAYLDQNGNVTAVSANIRTVTISATAQWAARSGWVTMVDRIRLRNR